MKQSTLLYGKSLTLYADLPYKVVLVKKIVLGHRLLYRLVREQNMEDTRRMRDVSKAMDFNRELLLELGFESTEITKMVRDELNGKHS